MSTNHCCEPVSGWQQYWNCQATVDTRSSLFVRCACAPLSMGLEWYSPADWSLWSCCWGGFWVTGVNWRARWATWREECMRDTLGVTFTRAGIQQLLFFFWPHQVRLVSANAKIMLATFSRGSFGENKRVGYSTMACTTDAQKVSACSCFQHANLTYATAFFAEVENINICCTYTRTHDFVLIDELCYFVQNEDFLVHAV